MFKIGDKVVNIHGKVFEIIGVEEKDYGSGNNSYFVLSPFFQYDFIQGSKAYVPVDKADSLLRTVMKKEEAIKFIDSFDNLDTLSNVSYHERKTMFQNLISSGSRTAMFTVIKSLLCYKKERAKINKPFSDYDRKLLTNLSTIIKNELSLSLNLKVEDVPDFVNARLGKKILD